MRSRRSYRAVFLSDVHLGSSASRADEAADFLKGIETPNLYLVGDIIDMWRLRSRWHWPEANNKFVRRVLKMAKRGTRVIFIPGNHDEHAREYVGLNFGGVQLAREAIHTTADGRRLLVVHGDEIDLVVKHARLLSVIGGVAYERLVMLNHWTNRLRRVFGLRPWSLSQAIKLRVKKACQHIAKFEATLASEAHRRGLDGVVCGHIHKAEAMRLRVEGQPEGTDVEYFNCGDWVESCTALLEHEDGRLEIVEAAHAHDHVANEIDDHEHDADPIEPVEPVLDHAMPTRALVHA
jgi:UDP-2,3-diacylglucosamine pyrophosphatase LpxH